MGAARFAAIDVGSNAMRLRVAERAHGGGAARKVMSERWPVRLGRDVFRCRRFTAETLAVATHALVRFREAMDRAGVVSYRAVATSATRDAANGAELVRRARKEAGIELDIIDGSEEARLVALAVTRALPLAGRTALADIGGGSTEITLMRGTTRVRSASLPLGTVRLLEACHPRGGPMDRRRLAVLTEVVDRALGEAEVRLEGVDAVITTGGTVTALAKLCGREGHTVSVADLDGVLDRLRKMSETERSEAFGVRPDRADTIVPAAVVLSRVCAAAGVRTVDAPGVGVREGILAELTEIPTPRLRGTRASTPRLAASI